MSTTTSPSPFDPSQTGFSPFPSPSQGNQGTNNPSFGQLPSISLSLYIFSVILILFVIVLSGFVFRSVRRRRLRNAAHSALTSGAHGSAQKPAMWEAYIETVDDEEKGWTGIWTVAVAMPGPMGDAKHQPGPEHPTPRRSRLRFPSLHSRISSNPSQTSNPSEPPLTPAMSSGPAQLTVLIAMPNSIHGEAGNENGNGGPPVVELGITQVSYAPAPNVP